MTDKAESNGSIEVAGTYTVQAPTTESQGFAFILYGDQSVKWATISQLEEDADDEPV